MKNRPTLTPISLMLVVTGLLCCLSALAQANYDQQLADQLKTHYQLTSISLDPSGAQVVTRPGTVLVVQKGGILGVPPTNDVALTATWRDNQLHGPSASLLFAANITKPIAVGERVYVGQIEVSLKKDKVSLLVVECDSCNGRDVSSYKSFVAFQFPKGYLASAQVDQVEDVVSQVLTIDTGNDDSQQQAQDAVSQSSQAPGLTNDDVLKMVHAQLPDSVVLAKIKASNCQFDTSPDALIGLKQAGVSEAVLKAIAEAPVSGSDTQAEAPSAPVCGEYNSCLQSGLAALKSFQLDQAVPYFQQASELNPSGADAWAGLGYANFGLGRYDDATAAFDRALQLGSTLEAPVCHAKALCGDTGTFRLSMKEVSFTNGKGEKELAAAPSAVSSEGAVLFGSARTPAYYLNIRFGEKNYRFYHIPTGIQCQMNFVCPEPGLTRQKVFADYVHGALARMASGSLVSSPNPR